MMAGVLVRGAGWGVTPGLRAWRCRKVEAQADLNHLGSSAFLVSRDNALRTASGAFLPIPKRENGDLDGPSPGSKSFIAVPNLDGLVTLINSFPETLRNFYEIVDSTKPGRLGFDLDMVGGSDREAFLTHILGDHIIPYLQALCSRAFTPADFAVLDASSEGVKLSFHVVTDILITADYRPAIKSSIQLAFHKRDGIDTGVYDTDRNMRLPFNAKIDSKNRVLRPVASVGSLVFKPTPTDLGTDCLRVHMWTSQPVDPIHPVGLVVAPMPVAPRGQPRPKRPRDGGGGHELVARVLGETDAKPVDWTTKDRQSTRWDMNGTVRACPTGETHRSNGFCTWENNDGQLMYMCFAPTCSSRYYTLGPAVPYAGDYTVEHAAEHNVAWRAFGKSPTDVPKDIWSREWNTTAGRRPQPWNDAPLLAAFNLEPHVYRGEHGPRGPILHAWLFGCHKPCPFCRDIHCDPQRPYKVAVLRGCGPTLYAPCKAAGKQLRAPSQGDDQFDALLAAVRDAAPQERLEAALRLLIWADGGDEEKYRGTRVHGGTGQEYTYGGQARRVRYDAANGFQLVCASVGGAGTFQIVAKGGRRASDTSMFFDEVI